MEVQAPYNAGFVEELKRRIPSASRSWVKPVWVIDGHHEGDVIELCILYYNDLPYIIEEPVIPITKSIRLEYIGRCKDQYNESLASGYVGGSWSVLFKESALREFFEGSPIRSRQEDITYYQVLGIPEDVDQDQIKKAYRRLSKQWHPDVNRDDPDAEDMFKRINKANEVLRDPIRRRKYNFALLALKDSEEANDGESTIGSSAYYPQLRYPPSPYFVTGMHQTAQKYGYRSPLRCGIVDVHGTMKIGRLIVDKIDRWADIYDEQGRMMVVSWPKDAETWEVRWI